MSQILSDYYQSEQDNDSDFENIHVMAADKQFKKPIGPKKVVFDGVELPFKHYSKLTPGPTHQYNSFKGNKDNNLFKGKQGLAKENKSIPLDVREKRTNIEIKDITMDDVTNKLHKKPQSVEPSKDGANQLQKMHNQIRQSEISLGLGETEVVDSILCTPVTLSFREILGTSRELADKLSDMIKRKNVEQPQVSSVMHIPRDRARLLRLPMKCGENYISAIIDTGSMLNVVKREVYQKCIKLPIDPARCNN
jgi:predicted XRE-type DNA-binding protein